MDVHPRICLITRGDDLGTFQASNRAIVDAFEHGILRNASLMVPAPNFLHAAQLVKKLPGLCLGLHITLTSEWDTTRWGPVSPPELVPSLVGPDQCFFSTSQELFQHSVDPEEALQEVRAQLNLARELGLDMRYLDEHMGIGWIFDPAIPQRKRLSEIFRQLAHEEGLVWHEDLTHIQKLECDLADLPLALSQLQEGSYVLITHPSYAEPEIQEVTGQAYPLPGDLAQTRWRDYQMLCDPRVVQIVREREIQLVRYDEMLLCPTHESSVIVESQDQTHLASPPQEHK